MNVMSSASQGSSPSRSSRESWRRRAGLLRFGAGPLALAGFFLPWASGPGALAGTEFTGFTLVGFAGRLQSLELSLAAGGALWAIRLAILGVAVAASWQILLAPGHRHHLAYPTSGWYLVAAGGTLLALGVARSGLVVPPIGFVLVVLAGALYLMAQFGAGGGADRMAIDSPPR